MAVSYRVLSVHKTEDTIFTEVSYTKNNNVVVASVIISHFRPANLAEIDQNIKTRWQSEKIRLQAIAAVDALPNVPLNQDINIAGE